MGVKVNDCVKIKGTDLEGEVTWADARYSRFEVRVQDGSQWYTLPGELLEALPRPVKVGDVITGVDAYEALPIGAVVHPSIDINCALFRTESGFIDARGNHYGPRSFSCPRTVVYLPGQ